MDQASFAAQARYPADVFDVVHARILRFFPELVRELGGDPVALTHAAGRDCDALLEDNARATYRQSVHLIEYAASALNCPDFGMRLAVMQGGGMYGPLGTVMKNSKTFGDALAYVSEHNYAHSLASRIHMTRLDGGGAFSSHDILLDGMPNKSQAMEQVILLGHLGAMEITGGKARVRKVHFRHEPVSPLKTYRRYFGCDVLFGQNEDGVFFFDRDLACATIDPDAQVYLATTSYIDAEFTQHSPPIHAQARGVIMQYLGADHCNNDQVAAELSLHPRTLQRRLRAEGTSFQQIKDDVRRDLMLYYIQQTEFEFTRISEKLGFAEQSVFTRCCKRWLSASPTELRQRARLSQAS